MKSFLLIKVLCIFAFLWEFKTLASTLDRLECERILGLKNLVGRGSITESPEYLGSLKPANNNEMLMFAHALRPTSRSLLIANKSSYAEVKDAFDQVTTANEIDLRSKNSSSKAKNALKKSSKKKPKTNRSDQVFLNTMISCSFVVTCAIFRGLRDGYLEPRTFEGLFILAASLFGALSLYDEINAQNESRRKNKIPPVPKTPSASWFKTWIDSFESSDEVFNILSFFGKISPEAARNLNLPRDVAAFFALARNPETHEVEFWTLVSDRQILLKEVMEGSGSKFKIASTNANGEKSNRPVRIYKNKDSGGENQTETSNFENGIDSFQELGLEKFYIEGQELNDKNALIRLAGSQKVSWQRYAPLVMARLKTLRDAPSLESLNGVHDFARYSGHVDESLYGYYRIKIDSQFRLVFRWDDLTGRPSHVAVVDYHGE